MAKSSVPKQTAYRDSKTGGFITKKKADSLPASRVEKEAIKHPKKG